MVADRCACVPCVLGECTNGPVASQCRYSATFLPVGAVLSRTPQLSWARAGTRSAPSCPAARFCIYPRCYGTKRQCGRQRRRLCAAAYLCSCMPRASALCEVHDTNNSRGSRGFLFRHNPGLCPLNQASLIHKYTSRVSASSNLRAHYTRDRPYYTQQACARRLGCLLH
jgi:hypothetical protein